jgi:hypothetical protein
MLSPTNNDQKPLAKYGIQTRNTDCRHAGAALQQSTFVGRLVMAKEDILMNELFDYRSLVITTCDASLYQAHSNL